MQSIRDAFEPRISIITLGVRDMRRSIEFYRDGLGLPTNAELDGHPWEIAWHAAWRFADDGTLWGDSLGDPPG